jgi:hypothetical protein
MEAAAGLSDNYFIISNVRLRTFFALAAIQNFTRRSLARGKSFRSELLIKSFGALQKAKVSITSNPARSIVMSCIGAATAANIALWSWGLSQPAAPDIRELSRAALTQQMVSQFATINPSLASKTFEPAPPALAAPVTVTTLSVKNVAVTPTYRYRHLHHHLRTRSFSVTPHTETSDFALSSVRPLGTPTVSGSIGDARLYERIAASLDALSHISYKHGVAVPKDPTKSAGECAGHDESALSRSGRIHLPQVDAKDLPPYLLAQGFQKVDLTKDHLRPLDVVVIAPQAPLYKIQGVSHWHGHTHVIKQMIDKAHPFGHVAVNIGLKQTALVSDFKQGARVWVYNRPMDASKITVFRNPILEQSANAEIMKLALHVPVWHHFRHSYNSHRYASRGGSVLQS